jgi:hypothetical protein
LSKLQFLSKGSEKRRAPRSAELFCSKDLSFDSRQPVSATQAKALAKRPLSQKE